MEFIELLVISGPHTGKTFNVRKGIIEHHLSRHVEGIVRGDILQETSFKDMYTVELGKYLVYKGTQLVGETNVKYVIDQEATHV